MFWFLYVYASFPFGSQLTHEPPAASDRITIKLQKQTRPTSQWARDPEITEAAAQSGAELGFMAARLNQPPLRTPPPPGRCAWGKSGSHLKLISRLKSVCRRQIGRIKSTEGPWHRRSTGPLSARPPPPLHLRTPQVLLARSDWD